MAEAGLLELIFRAKLDRLDADLAAGRAKATAAGEAMGTAMANGLGAKFAAVKDKIGSVLSPAKLKAGMGAFSAVVGGSLAEVGDKLEKAENQLKAAGEAAGIPLKDLDEIAKKANSSMENFGFKTTDTDAALQKFIQAGRPASEVQKDMALAADLAAAKHMKLSDAAGLISKVYGGNARVLREFGITLKDVADPQAALTQAEKDNEKTQAELGKVVEENKLKHMAYAAAKTHSKVATEELQLSDKKLAEVQQTAKASTEHLTQAQADAATGTTRMGTVMDDLSGKLKGQAAASVETFGGKMEVAKTKIEDFVAKGAAKIGPAMATAGPALMGVGGLIQSGLVPALISGVGSAASFGAGMIGAGISAVGAALPVIIAWAPVILTLAVLGVAAYELYQHWDEVFGFVKGVILGAAKFIGDRFDDIVGFVSRLPGRAVSALSSLGGDIAGVASSAMSSMWDAVSGGASDLVGFVGGIPGRIVDALGDMGSLLWDAGAAVLRGFLDGLKSAWGAVTGFVGGIGGWIADHKGPVSSDARLLIPAGAAIMGGLVGGLRAGRPALDRELAGITASFGGGTGSGSLANEGANLRGTDAGAPGGRGGTTYIVQGSLVTQRQLESLGRNGTANLARYNGSSGVR